MSPEPQMHRGQVTYFYFRLHSPQIEINLAQIILLDLLRGNYYHSESNKQVNQ